MTPLERDARQALAAIRRIPAAFVVSAPAAARWAEAVAHLADALATFASIAAGDSAALLHAARIGDAELAVDAADAADGLRNVLRNVANAANVDRGRWGDELANGEQAGEEGQRRLVSIAHRGGRFRKSRR